MTIENIEDITLAELENMINKYHDNIDFKAYISAVNEESKKNLSVQTFEKSKEQLYSLYKWSIIQEIFTKKELSSEIESLIFDILSNIKLAKIINPKNFPDLIFNNITVPEISRLEKTSDFRLIIRNISESISKKNKQLKDS